MSLHLLKIGNCNSIFILKNIANISCFLLNLVLLAVLEGQGFIWLHRLREIQSKKSEIIRFTVR